MSEKINENPLNAGVRLNERLENRVDQFLKLTAPVSGRPPGGNHYRACLTELKSWAVEHGFSVGQVDVVLARHLSRRPRPRF